MMKVKGEIELAEIRESKRDKGGTTGESGTVMVSSFAIYKDSKESRSYLLSKGLQFLSMTKLNLGQKALLPSLPPPIRRCGRKELLLS